MKNAIELNKIFPEHVSENEVPVMIMNFETDEITAEWMLLVMQQCLNYQGI